MLSLRLVAAIAVACLIASAARADIPSLVKRQAHAAGVPTSLALAIVRHESGFKPHVTGRAGEIGLMQVKLATARSMGYRGSRKGLYDPATNLRYGLKYLAAALRRAGGNHCHAATLFNRGIFARPRSSAYCRQVLGHG